jgi:hypothetical protein
MGRSAKLRKSRRETIHQSLQWQQELSQQEQDNLSAWVVKLDRGMAWDLNAAIATCFEHPEPGFVSVVYGGGITGIGFVSAQGVSAEQFSRQEWEWLNQHLYASNRKALRISLGKETNWQCFEYVEMHAIQHFLSGVLD